MFADNHKKWIAAIALGAMCLTVPVGCGAQKPAGDGASQTQQAEQKDKGTANGQEKGQETSQVASKEEMVTPVAVVEEGWTEVCAADLVDGDYPITVNSSSGMFKVVDCVLHVNNGIMTADMTMGGTGYLYVFMGTGEEAAAANEKDYIPFRETEAGHVFTVPVAALNRAIDCAAFSKNKEKWYDRQLAFLAQDLPLEAYKVAPMMTAKDMHLVDGKYTMEVTLTGGSGKAYVESPALITVKDGEATATLVWSSKNYDYVRIGDTKYQPISTDPTAVFEIPVIGFDYDMPIAADTTAMSQPHEIQYTLHFRSGSIENAE